ncbi:hypothetical protein [Endozoicomonas acroporae]|uniref:hypothetical protein n=1 Tax=Endozoicomonas acroporae TaxID=1701104 RepID=UPI0013D0825B|nr:hypothetical protein [Endozoicomonas acroporae]
MSSAVDCGMGLRLAAYKSLDSIFKLLVAHAIAFWLLREVCLLFEAARISGDLSLRQ